MRTLKLIIAFAVSAVTMAALHAPVFAQTAPQSRTIPVTFTGYVANNVTDEIRIRMSDGSYAPFTGSVPDYPYRQGDPVTISFNAVMPTAAAYQAGGALQNAASADGIYRIRVRNPFYSSGGGPLGIGNSTTADDGAGPIQPIDTFGQPTNTLMTLVYDAIADSYSIDFSNGGFLSSAHTGPSYVYDAATQTLSLCQGVSCGDLSQNARFALNGNANQISATNIGINGSVPGTGPQSGSRTGLFDLIFSGSWNLPTHGSDPIDVPEPGTVILFGGGAAFLVRRRRLAKRKASASHTIVE